MKQKGRKWKQFFKLSELSKMAFQLVVVHKYM